MPASHSTTHSPGPAAARTADRTRSDVRGFASSAALSRQELTRAPVRWPRPSRLRAPLEPKAAKKLAGGLRALGLQTVGDLLEHLPSDSREARSVAALRAGEQATVTVEVRRIASRSVRRRGMRPLVEATVFDATGTMRATFFNQPWLRRALPAGHTRCCCTARPMRAGASASPTTRPAHRPRWTRTPFRTSARATPWRTIRRRRGSPRLRS